ncbi:MAG TPA: glycosyltransferase family 4 protein [Candidatus Sumerlaeota bacterium]|nr:glycosyltransferase family 4 protein [Candidatus Sumerlaeota bacterium]
MKLALISSSPVPRVYGGMDRLLEGLTEALRQRHPTDLITYPVDERTADGVLRGYYDFYTMDLSAYDAVISYKAPAYMVRHPVQVLYLSHRLRVFYDLYEQRDAHHAKMRRLVQWMDNWAMSPERIPHIFCVGKTVTRRLRRWGGIASTPIHHPTTFVPDPPREGEHFLAVGRLHPWKRFDLIIQAMRASRCDVPLLIVGSGPDEGRLRELAAGDSRIRFLGHVDENRLRELYARSIGHIFPPINEDLGMITFESFLAGKPVLTTTDSGEPAEIVEHGKTGFVVEPNPAAMAERLDWMATHFSELEEMGRHCIERVRDVTWERLVDRLLDAVEKTRQARAGSQVAIHTDRESPRPRDEKIHLLVTDNQIIDPPQGGGRVRIWQLYRHLPADFVTTYLGTHDHPGPVFRDQWLAPNFREIIMPLTIRHFKMHEVWRRLTRGDATVDVTIPLLLGRHSPRYQRLLHEHLQRADLLIVSHPWMTPWLPSDGPPLIYDSHNCEPAVKEPLLKRTLAGRYLARRVEQVEREAVTRARLVLACSHADAEQFERRYGAPPEKLLHIPNGVDCDAIAPVEATRRHILRRRLGIPDRPFAIFVGSHYGPNMDAAEFLIRQLAPQLTELTVGIIGGVGPAWREQHGDELPANVRLFGFVDAEQLVQLYQCADLGLNPMQQGSGTNIKMLDYMAAGLPIVTTETGARGLAGENGVHWCNATVFEFPQAVRELLAAPARAAEMGRAARRLAEEVYDWARISLRLLLGRDAAGAELVATLREDSA